MIVTIFRSRLRPDAGEAYHEVAVRMEALARAMPGFVSFKTFAAPDEERVSLVEFADEASHTAWRNHPEHREAQARGRSDFYAEFHIQVCSVDREYGFVHDADTP